MRDLYEELLKCLSNKKALITVSRTENPFHSENTGKPSLMLKSFHTQGLADRFEILFFLKKISSKFHRVCYIFRNRGPVQCSGL